LSSTPKPNLHKPRDPYRSIVANNAINQLTFNMRVRNNVRTPLPHERISRIQREATGNIEMAQLMCMFKFGYFFLLSSFVKDIFSYYNL